MSPLPNELRSLLERAIIKAREEADEAAKVALTALAVMRDEPFSSLTAEQRRLRVALRAKARQLGGSSSKDIGLKLLVEEVAYVQWHRRLFARFLAENNLLIHPEGIPVTLEECGELAAEEGEVDAWQLAARYASAMLPGIFRTDDPAAQVQFSSEGRHELECIITDLPPMLFTADDSLGWAYQFWQTKKKREVNLSGQKIGGDNLSTVTQLFTEHYMVQFLLENSLGAWWAARHPTSPLLKQFTYLRFREDGTPASGTFPEWPERAAEVTVMDPCCGSGHFLVAAFEMLRRMRMEEERLSEVQAADAVLCQNLFGLELDARCTQIAAFALAFAAWKAGGYRQLRVPNIACSGIAVAGQLESWTRLAGDDENLRMTLERHYHLFRIAPDLGSLVDPNDVPIEYRMFNADYALVEPLLKRALARQRKKDDPTAVVFGVAAEGVAKAVRLLARTYTLVVTNVPYISSVKQDVVLKQFCEVHYPNAKADLATAFIERCRSFTTPGGSYAVVTPQNWLFLSAYNKFRKYTIEEQTWNHLSRLGSRAFETISGEVVNVALLILTNQALVKEHIMTGIDASVAKTAQEKAILLCTAPLQMVGQRSQLNNPDARIALEEKGEEKLLAEYADSYWGLGSGDYPRFGRYFWELPELDDDWIFQLSTVTKTTAYGGREHILFWENGEGELVNSPGAFVRATHIWGKQGVLVSQTGHLPVTLYTGEAFDTNCSPIISKNPSHLPAIWAFCQSPKFNEAVRQIDQALKVTNATLLKVPFDLECWQKVADAAGPLPEPYSNDPTQWLFNGLPVDSTAPLQVAVARLLGYSWPQQKLEALDAYTGKDCIICLPHVAGEDTAAERLRVLLATAYGVAWSPAQQERLLAGVGASDKSLDVWLRDGFFAQHCTLFHNRPFIWHVWDGRKDGFSALVNYHQLDAACLERLIYTYLGSWIRTQKVEQDGGVIGAGGRLAAAINLKKKLEAIREGESPYDIYVRWKPLHQQPLGWNPDLNDGVRVNIRSFVEAGVLRSRFAIHWNKDRGTNPDGTERLNDVHYSLAVKQQARKVTV